MSRFVNDQTKVVVNVDDSKDERFGAGWTAEKAPAEKPVAKKAAASKSE